MRVIAILITPLLLLACTPTPEIGDPRYIEAQRMCLAVDINEFLITYNETSLLEGDPPNETELNEIKRKCKNFGYEWVHTTDFPRTNTQELAEVKGDKRAPQPASASQSSLEGESPQRPIVMTYYQLQDLLLGDDPGATIETLNGNWVQITGPTNGRGGQGGGPSDRNRPEYLTYTLVMNEFGPSMYPKSIAITCWSRQGDTRIKDFRTPPKREVTIIGIYEQSRALFPKLKSCQVLQDGSNSAQSLAPR